MYARITGFVLAFALAVSGLATAQERFGALTGKITDQTSAALPGVTVTATNTQTGESRVFVTGADGVFRAPDLVPGRYTVKFELSGFSSAERGCGNDDKAAGYLLAAHNFGGGLHIG